jgi:hypothetical protein
MTEKRPPNDRGQGRKPLPVEDRSVAGSIRLTVAEWAKFRALGGAEWLREKLKKTKP